MATAGYSMKFGKGYLGGQQEAPAHEPEMAEGGEEHHAAIHEHLANMHAQTGHGHSHIEHHQDGSHTSHHVSHEGEISGPHHHASAEELVNHLKSHLPEEEGEIESEEEPEEGE